MADKRALHTAASQRYPPPWEPPLAHQSDSSTSTARHPPGLPQLYSASAAAAAETLSIGRAITTHPYPATATATPYMKNEVPRPHHGERAQLSRRSIVPAAPHHAATRSTTIVHMAHLGTRHGHVTQPTTPATHPPPTTRTATRSDPVPSHPSRLQLLLWMIGVANVAKALAPRDLPGGRHPPFRNLLPVQKDRDEHGRRHEEGHPGVAAPRRRVGPPAAGRGPHLRRVRVLLGAATHDKRRQQQQVMGEKGKREMERDGGGGYRLGQRAPRCV